MNILQSATDSFPYELRSFPAALADGTVPAAVAKWTQAVQLGFHGGVLPDAAIHRFVGSEERDARMNVGAYALEVPSGAWDADYPVATYATNRKTINVGEGKQLPAHLITAVTVRPSHRRRGLLRAMITADLESARERGLPMAALTASEATIYGRFGFGVATHAATVEVDTGGFALHGQRRGTVEVVDPALLEDLEPRLIEDVQATTFGSVGRQDAYRFLASGAWTYESPEPDPKIRAAVHFGPDGVPDGYVSYKMTSWQPAPPTVEIRDLLATNSAAYLGLWDFLGHLDLVGRIRWSLAPVEDPLEWALANKRSYRVSKISDVLWLRVLDPVAVLSARHYWGSGTVTVRLADPLGLADGVFRIAAEGASVVVKQLGANAAVDLDLGVGELGSLYLGGVSARVLAAAGRIVEHSAGAAASWDALFAVPRRPHCLTEF